MNIFEHVDLGLPYGAAQLIPFLLINGPSYYRNSCNSLLFIYGSQFQSLKWLILTDFDIYLQYCI